MRIEEIMLCVKRENRHYKRMNLISCPLSLKWTKYVLKCLVLVCIVPLLTQCSTRVSDEEERTAIIKRNQHISQEVTGNFFYARRYYIPSTRFWGYLRQPRQPWSQAKLVIVDESKIKTPDRLPETTSSSKSYKKDHGYDKNFQYKFCGYYTGKTAYEPNTNQVLPIFKLTDWELDDDKAGFLFTPKEKYSEELISIVPTLIPYGLR